MYWFFDLIVFTTLLNLKYDVVCICIIILGKYCFIVPQLWVQETVEEIGSEVTEPERHDPKSQPTLGEDYVLAYAASGQIRVIRLTRTPWHEEGGHEEGIHHTQMSAQFDVRLWDECVAQPGTALRSLGIMRVSMKRITNSRPKWHEKELRS